jgi:hypothetical protein
MNKILAFCPLKKQGCFFPKASFKPVDRLHDEIPREEKQMPEAFRSTGKRICLIDVCTLHCISKLICLGEIACGVFNYFLVIY